MLVLQPPAPSTHVHLLTPVAQCVEEVEERMLDHMEDIIQDVRDSLAASPEEDGAQREATEAELEALAKDINGEPAWEADEEEPEYVDDEGAFEGDLDVDDD